MKNNFCMRFSFIVLLLTWNLFAIEGKINVFLKEHDTLYTSQKVMLEVELMTDAFSITDAKITFPSSKQYIVQAPKSAELISQVEINGTNWSTVQYKYDIYVMQAGEIEIPSVEVTFSASMGYGQPQKTFHLKSETLHIEVKTPKGFPRDTFVLVTNSYALDYAFNPQEVLSKKQLIVGDAIELKVTQKAQNVLDIMLKPVVYQSNAHLRVYSKEPELKSGLSATLDVLRTDSFTFVASLEGNVSIPEQTMFWWNSEIKKIQKESIPAVSFEIIADPQIAIDEKKAKRKQVLFYIVFFLLILFTLYKLFSSQIKNYFLARKQHYAKSEKGRYMQLLTSIDESNVSKVYSDMYAWLSVMDKHSKVTTLRDAYALYPEIKTYLLDFEETLFSKNNFDRNECLAIVKHVRHVLLKSRAEQSVSLESKLNP